MNPNIYVTTHPPEAAVLHCLYCADWEVDIDGTALPDVVRRAADHMCSADGASWTADGNPPKNLGRSV